MKERKAIFRFILAALLILAGTVTLSCELFTPGLGDEIDLEKPVVGIESHGNGDYIGGTIHISGFVSDDAGIESVTLSNGSNSYAANVANGQWDLNLDTTPYPDGEYEVVIKAVDTSDKETSISVLFIVDNSPPSVLVTTPTEYGTDKKFNKWITIKGEAADTTRVSNVYISLYDSDDDSAIFVDEQATGGSSWYYVFNSENYGGLLGDYYFVIRAEDPSGNKNSFFYHFEDLLDIAVDAGTTPNIEEINAADFQGVPIPGSVISSPLSTIRKSADAGKRMEINIDPNSDEPQFTLISPSEGSLNPSENIFSSPQKISGFVEDDDLAGIDETTLSIAFYDWDSSALISGYPVVYGDGSNPAFVLNGTQWSYSCSLPDGDYGVQLSVNDASGTGGISNLVPFRVSSFAPVVTIEDPQQGVYIGRGSTTNVEVSVVGASGDEVYIDLNDDGVYTESADPALNERMSPTGVPSHFSIDIIEGTNLTMTNGDGLFKIRAGVNSNFGHTTLQYTGDVSEPSVLINYPSDGQDINGTVTISGTSADNYLISKVYVYISTETDPALLPTDYESSWITPTGTYNWTVQNYDTNSLTDLATYTVFVKAIDAAGNESDLTDANSHLEFNVDQESDRPVINLSNMVEGGSSNSLGQDASIIGLIEDDDSVDASTLEVRIDIGNDGVYGGVDLNGDTDTDDANESEDWVAISPAANDVRILSWAYSLLNVPQGTHSMQIRVHDTVSDGVTFNEGTNPNFAELAVTEFIIDYGPPTLAITSPANGAVFNTGFTIEGTATDPNNVTDVEISFDAGSTYQSLYSDATGLEDVNWSYNFSVDAGGADDGEYSYQIRATDSSGGKTTLDRQLVVDATAPTITFEQPPELAIVNGTSLAIQGTANDNRGIAAVYISINPELTSPPADISTWNAVTGIYSWSYSLDSTALNNSATAANFVISVAAIDSAGNESSQYTRTISIDQGSDRPVISFNDIDKDETVASNNVLVGANYLSGIVEDDDLINPALFGGEAIEILFDLNSDGVYSGVDINGDGYTGDNPALGAADDLETESWIPVSDPPASSGKIVSWKHGISELGEGVHKVKVRVRDNLSDGTVGDSSVSAEYTGNFNWEIEDSTDQGGIPFVINVGPPTVTVVSPLANSYHNSSVTINGTAADVNGVSSVIVTYSKNGGADQVLLNDTTDDGVWSTNLDAVALGDGTYELTITATDGFGETTEQVRNIYVDTVSPDLTVETPVNGEVIDNTSYSISGKISDNGGAGIAELQYSRNNTDWTDIIKTGISWSAVVDFSSPESGETVQGDRTLYIRTTDGLNPEVVETISFSFDTADPLIGETTIGSEALVVSNGDVVLNGTASDSNQLSTLELSINGGAAQIIPVTSGNWTYTQTNSSDGLFELVFTATDAVGRTATLERNVLIDTVAPSPVIDLPADSSFVSGSTYTARGTVTESNNIASVDYRVDGSGWATVSGYENWTQSLGLVALGPGNHTLEVRAADEAGNTGSASLSFIVDLNSPTVTETGLGSSTAFMNGSFSLSGDVLDDVDVANLTVTQSKDGGAAATIYNYDFTGSNDLSDTWNLSSLPDGGVATGQYEYVLTITDSAGKSSTLTRTVTIDVDAPNVEVTSLLPMLTGNYVNGIVTLSVNASDANGMTGVKYFTRTSGGAPDYADADGTLITAPYSTTIDTETDLIDTQAYTLWVVGRDKAGNDSVSSMTFTVDQSSDVPSGGIDSPADGDLIGADRKVRGTFSDDDGVAANDAILFIRKVGAGSYTQKPIATSSSAGQLVAWTIDVADVLTAGGDGSYEMYFTVTDDDTKKAGMPAATYDTSSSIQTFFYDQNSPTVSAVSVSPIETAYAADDVLTLSWTAADASGLNSQSVDVDGVSTGLGSVTNTGGDNYEITYTVPASGISSGNKTFTLVAEDATGRTTTRTVTFLVDIDDPEVDSAFVLNPTFVGFTPNGQFEIKGTASDNRGLSSVELNLSGPDGNDGAVWTAGTLVNGNWTYNVADSSVYVATSGDLTINVRATDNAGNVSTTEVFTQVVDQSADKASVTVISPVDASTYGTTVQLSGTATDDDNLADISPDDGTIDTDAIEIDYDTVPTSGGWTTVNPTITGSGNSANWNYTLTGLAGGNYIMRVRAKDDADWGDYTSEVGFTVNAGAPNLIVSTSVDSFRSNSTLALAGTVEDSDGVVDVRVRVNGGTWNTVNADDSGSWGAGVTGVENWSYNLNLGSDGLKTIEIQAEDDSSFIANEQFSTRVDTTAPNGNFDTLFQDNPTGSYLDTSILNGEVRINGTVTELNLIDTDPVQIRIAEWNGSSEVNEILAYTAVTGTYVWNYVWDTSALADRQYILQLKIEDKAGNITDTITKVITTDQSADDPEVTQAFVDAPASGDAGDNVLQTLLKVSGTLSDDDGFNSGAVDIYLDGSATPISASNTSGTTATWDYTWATLAQGEHYLSLEVTDRNGNVATAGPTYFLVDTANPSLGVTAPIVGAKVKSGTLTINGTASDGGGLNANALSITLDHSNNASPLEGISYTPVIGGGTFSQDVTIDNTTLDGTLYINFVLTDRAGKQTNLTRSVTIDTTSPSLSLNYPSSEAYINGLVSVTGTADDANGLSDVTLEVLDPDTKLPILNLTRSSSTLAAWEFPFNSFSYASTTYGVDVNGDGKLWQVFFRLAATDNSGNVTEYLPDDPNWPYFYIDTDGDKPAIGVTQPKNGENIGGFVNMFGTATDDDGPVMQVEVRIDFNGDDDFSDTRDINNDDTDDDPDTGIALGADQDIFGNTVRIGDPVEMWEDESAWYVVDVTNNAWSMNLNTSNELYASNTGGTGEIVIQVRTRDKFGLASEIIERTITLDETFPRIENILPLDQTYQNGTFSLTAEFGDNEQLNLSDNSVIGINVNKTGYTYFTAASPELTLNAPNFGYDLSYDINTDLYFPGSSGILYLDMYVRDQALYQNQKSYTFYVDNQDPSSEWSDRSGAPDGSNLANGMITVNGSDRTYIEGNYGDSGAVSGISHIEVYFVDAGGDVLNIQSSGTWGGAVGTENIDIQTYDLGTNTWTDTTDPAAVFVTNDDLGDSYVMKIDKATEMSSQTLGTDVDGDGYEEFLGIVSGAPRWRGYFDSQYLPDGLTVLHYVVYDLAGNYVHRMREVFIANNGPDIDRIRIGSDLNASGDVTNTGSVLEVDDYYYPDGSIDLTSAVKIKNDRIEIQVEGSDSNGSITDVYVDVYDATSVTRYGQLATNPGSPLTSETTIAGSPWNDGYGIYNLKVIVRDDDQISQSHWVKVELIDPADSTAPVMTLNPLSQNDQDSDIGHLELQGDYGAEWSVLSAEYGDDDPKASGVLIITGTVTDENRIEEISALAEGIPVSVVADWVSGELVSQTADFVIDDQILNESGHTVDFTYKWDTSNVTGVAGLDKIITFDASDGTNSAVDQNQQVDVVPYITGISRDSGTYNTYRSRQGWYVLRQAELVTVKGFNLFSTTSDLITFNNTSGGTTDFNLPGGASDSTFDIASLDAAVASGPVVLTVNNVVSINNLNNNALEYNTEDTAAADYDGSWLWTDDRYVHIWRSDDNQAGGNRGYFTGSEDPEYPAMTIDGSGVLYGSWSNYAASDIMYAPNNGGSSTVYHGYDPSEHTDIHFGTRETIVYNSNLYGNGAWSITGAGGTYIWDTNADSDFTGTAYSGAYVAEGLYHDQKLMQFINQRIVTSGNDIHVSYYDTDTKALKYYHHTSNDDSGYSQNFINVDGGYDGDDFEASSVYTQMSANYAWNDNHAVAGIHVSIGETVTAGQLIITLNNGSDVPVYADQAGVIDRIYVSLSDTDVDDDPLVDIVDVTGASRIVDLGGGSRAAAAGEFSAIDLTPTNNYPVIAYYDITNKSVRIARATAVNPDETGWNLQSVMSVSDENYQYAGKYISMKIDSSGYIHLAFFRNSTGDLVYLKSTNNPIDGATAYTFGDSVLIDTIGSVGAWADVTLDNDDPVISYLDSSLVNTFNGIKMAYYDPSLESESGDIADEPDTTDGWETMNAALGYEVESVRTSVETDTGSNFWQQAIGYGSNDYFRIGYYVK